MDPVPFFEREDFRDVVGQTLRPGGIMLTSQALDHCVLPLGALVADIGCGRGASLALLAERGFKPVGLDPSPRLLAEAREPGSGTVLIQATSEAIPFRQGTFSAVLCECVLTITRNPRAALTEMHRILSPGGLLVLTDLYLREPVDPLAPWDAARSSAEASKAAGCASGAVPRTEVEQRLQDTGFTVRVFEDHSRLLAELAGRLVFAGLDRAELGLGCSSAGRPGYYLCIAQTEAL
jgi:SAM-dependent methyltransferase